MFIQKIIVPYLFIVIIAVAIVAVSGMSFTVSAATNDITVYLDGQMLSFPDVQPQMINDRVMVPLRAIGEEMGADVEWNSATRVARLTLGDRFVRLTINSTVMNYGRFTGDGASRTELDVAMYVLTSPAVVINGRTLVPLRAISEGFGGTAEWDAGLRTAIITSPGASGLTTDSDVFADTPWFVNISPTRAQNMYENDEKFVLVYYSGDNASRTHLPIIKAAARESGVKTYGVDSRLPDSGALRFVNQYVHENDIVYPTVFRVFGRGSVGVSSRPGHQENLVNLLNLFVRDLLEDQETSWGPGGTDSSSMPDIYDSLNIRYFSIDLAAANRKLHDGEWFIYVFYRSTARNSERYLNIIKQAAIDAGVNIFATDASRHNYPDSLRWWGNPDGRMVYPTIFFIGNRRVMSIEERPENRNRLIQLFEDHW